MNNISTRENLRIAKMQYQYEIKLQENAMQSCISDLRDSAQESLNQSLRHFTMEFATKLAMNVLKHGRSKKR